MQVGRPRKRRFVSKGAVRTGKRVSRLALRIPPSIRDFQFFDFNVALGPAAGLQVATIFQPVQGTGSSNRYGDKVLAHSLQYQFACTAAIANSLSRVLIVYDKQPNGAVPAGNLPLTSASPVAFKDPDFRNRFVILRDFLIDNLPSYNMNQTKHDGLQKGIIKLNKISTFNGNAGAITDVTTGSYLFMIFSTNAAATVGQTRILFTS